MREPQDRKDCQAIELGVLHPRRAPSLFWEGKQGLSTSRNSSASSSPLPLHHQPPGLISPQNKRGTTILCTLVLASTAPQTTTEAPREPQTIQAATRWAWLSAAGGAGEMCWSGTQSEATVPSQPGAQGEAEPSSLHMLSNKKGHFNPLFLEGNRALLEVWSGLRLCRSSTISSLHECTVGAFEAFQFCCHLITTSDSEAAFCPHAVAQHSRSFSSL